MSPSHRLAPSLAACLALVACSAGADSSQSAADATVTDSAGVRLVEYPASALEIPLVTLPAPETTIGAEDGEGADVFGLIGQAARLTDGGIVVFDAWAHEVRVFEPDGSLRNLFGRAGQGPGELQEGTVSGLHLLPGDTIAVVDQLSQRVQLFSPDGQLIDTRLKGEVPGYWHHVGAFHDGSWLVQLMPPATGLPPTMGRNEIPQIAARVPADLSRADSLTVFLRSVGFLHDIPGDMVVNLQIPFSPAGAAAPLGDAVVGHDGSEYELRWVGRGASVRQLLRIDLAPHELSSAELDVEREQRLAIYSPDRRQSMERAFLEMPRERTLPAFGPNMISDRTNVFWVPVVPLPPSRTGEGQPAVPWLVIHNDGRLIGRVMLPATERPRHLDATHLVTTWRDDLDVERVNVYELPLELRG